MRQIQLSLVNLYRGRGGGAMGVGSDQGKNTQPKPKKDNKDSQFMKFIYSSPGC